MTDDFWRLLDRRDAEALESLWGAVPEFTSLVTALRFLDVGTEVDEAWAPMFGDWACDLVWAAAECVVVGAEELLAKAAKSAWLAARRADDRVTLEDMREKNSSNHKCMGSLCLCWLYQGVDVRVGNASRQ